MVAILINANYSRCAVEALNWFTADQRPVFCDLTCCFHIAIPPSNALQYVRLSLWRSSCASIMDVHKTKNPKINAKCMNFWRRRSVGRLFFHLHFSINFCVYFILLAEWFIGQTENCSAAFGVIVCDITFDISYSVFDSIVMTTLKRQQWSSQSVTTARKRVKRDPAQLKAVIELN